MKTKFSFWHSAKSASILLTLVPSLFLSFDSKAQSFVPSTSLGGSGHNIATDDPNANIGIGKFNGYPTPGDKLTLGGNMSMFFQNDYDGRLIMGRCDQGFLGLYSNSDEKTGSAIKLNGRYGLDFAHMGGILFYANSQGVTQPATQRAYDLIAFDPTSGTTPSSLVINHRGDVCIGDGDPDGEKLTVMGNIFLKQPASGERKIYGKTTGWMTMCSNSSIGDGSSLILYSSSQPQNPGEVRVSSYGATGAVKGFRYVNTDPNNSSVVERFSVERGGDAHMATSLNFDLTSNTSTSAINGTKDFSSLVINGGSAPAIGLGSTGGTIELCGSANATTPGEMHFVTPVAVAGNTVLNTKGGYKFMRNKNGTIEQVMKIQPDGKVIIGSSAITTPGNYQLYVQSGILTERVKIAISTTGDWADYVFDKNYKLMPLNDVADYIKQNNHLPNVPSAKEVVKEGIDIGQINAKLLQKIEELTLYTIQQQKALEEQSKAIALQQKEIEALKVNLRK